MEEAAAEIKIIGVAINFRLDQKTWSVSYNSLLVGCLKIS